jgi:hypothetical protein
VRRLDQILNHLDVKAAQEHRPFPGASILRRASRREITSERFTRSPR